jgi:hypothetical protein
MMEPMARDLMTLKETVKLLNNKLDAVVKSINAGGPITDESINKIMIENNAKDLKAKVDQMVAQGLLAASNTVESGSFVVISESNSAGEVVNPRMQFLLSDLQHEEAKTKLNGLKVGDSTQIGDSGGSVTVLEAYSVVVPSASETEAPAEAPAAETPAATEAAPAATEMAPAETPATETAPTAAVSA